MGIRPKVEFIMGVVDLEVDDYTIVDSRWHAPEDWQEWKIPEVSKAELKRLAAIVKDEDVTEEEHDEAFIRHSELELGVLLNGKNMYDVVTWSPEMGLPNVLGVVLDDLPYNNYCLWALASILDEHGLMEGAEPKFFELPLWPPEKDCSMPALWWKMYQENPEAVPENRIRVVQSYQKKLDRGWNYASGVAYLVEVFASRTMYVLRDVLSMDVEEKDLHLGLYWIWS